MIRHVSGIAEIVEDVEGAVRFAVMFWAWMFNMSPAVAMPRLR